MLAILLPSILNAKNVNGFDCTDYAAFYSIDKTIYALSHDNKNTLKKNLSEDSVFRLTLNTLARNYGCNPIQTTNSKNLDNFNIINLTCLKNQIFVCVGFNLLNQLENNSYKYGLIALNHQFKVINYYTFSNDTSVEYLNILPYFPMEFKDSNTFYTQFYKNGKKVGDFKLNKKNHRITKGTFNQSLYLPIDSIKFNFSVMQNNFVSPAISIPTYSKNNYFYLYPYPVLFNSKDFNSNYDHYNQKQNILKSYSPHNTNSSAPDYLFTLSQNTEQAYHTHILLTSQQNGDSLYTLVSSPLANTTDLIIFNTVNKKSTLLSIASKYKSNYCIIRNKKIYQLCLSENKQMVNVIELNFAD